MLFHNPKNPSFFREMRLIFEAGEAPRFAPAEKEVDFEKQYQKLQGAVTEKLFDNEEVLGEKMQEVEGALRDVDPATLKTFVEEWLASNLNYHQYNRLFCGRIMGFDVNKIKPGEQMQYAAALQLHLMRSLGREVFEHKKGLTAVDGMIGKYTLSVLAAYWNYSHVDQEPVAYKDQVKNTKYRNILASLEKKLATNISFNESEGPKFVVPRTQETEFEAKNATPLDAAMGMIQGLEEGMDGYLDLTDGTEAHVVSLTDGYQLEHHNTSYKFANLDELRQHLTQYIAGLESIERPSA